MKKKIKRLTILGLMLMLLVTPLTAFASEGEGIGNETESSDNSETNTTVKDSSGSVIADETGNALSDIISDDRFKGSIKSIKWVTTRIDSVTIMLVSGAAFFIISVAFLKNVCAGVYCSNSKFCDKVDEAHKKAEALSLATVKGYIGGGGFMNTSYGTLRDSLLAFVPNFKAWTPFDDADIDPKQYWSKAIPEMLFCVIIGIYIYNGYYRDTALKVGEFGSEAFKRVMMAADPTALLDRLSQTTGTPDFITDHLTTPEGKIANKITKDMFSATITYHTDITSTEQKEKLGAFIENKVIDFVNGKLISQLYEQGKYLKSYSISKINYSNTTTTVNEDGVLMCIVHPTDSGVQSTLPLKENLVCYVTLGEPDYNTEYKNGKKVSGKHETKEGNKTDEWATTTATVEVDMTSSGTRTWEGHMPSETVEGYRIDLHKASEIGTPLGNGTVASDGTVKYTGSMPAKMLTTTENDTIYAVDSSGKKYHLEIQMNGN